MVASPLLRLLARGRAEELEAAQGVAAVGRGEARQHCPDEAWLEDFLGSAEALAGGGEPHVPYSSVGLGAVSHDVALPHEAVDRDGHGGHRDAHVGGQSR